MSNERSADSTILLQQDGAAIDPQFQGLFDILLQIFRMLGFDENGLVEPNPGVNDGEPDVDGTPSEPSPELEGTYARLEELVKELDSANDIEGLDLSDNVEEFTQALEALKEANPEDLEQQVEALTQSFLEGVREEIDVYDAGWIAGMDFDGDGEPDIMTTPPTFNLRMIMFEIEHWGETDFPIDNMPLPQDPGATEPEEAIEDPSSHLKQVAAEVMDARADNGLDDPYANAAREFLIEMDDLEKKLAEAEGDPTLQKAIRQEMLQASDKFADTLEQPLEMNDPYAWVTNEDIYLPSYWDRVTPVFDDDIKALAERARAGVDAMADDMGIDRPDPSFWQMPINIPYPVGGFQPEPFIGLLEDMADTQEVHTVEKLRVEIADTMQAQAIDISDMPESMGQAVTRAMNYELGEDFGVDIAALKVEAGLEEPQETVAAATRDHGFQGPGGPGGMT